MPACALKGNPLSYMILCRRGDLFVSEGKERERARLKERCLLRKRKPEVLHFRKTSGGSCTLSRVRAFTYDIGAVTLDYSSSDDQLSLLQSLPAEKAPEGSADWLSSSTMPTLGPETASICIGSRLITLDEGVIYVSFMMNLSMM